MVGAEIIVKEAELILFVELREDLEVTAVYRTSLLFDCSKSFGERRGEHYHRRQQRIYREPQLLFQHSRA